MEIHKDRKAGKYIEKVLKCLGMKNTNDYSTCHSFQTFNSVSIEEWGGQVFLSHVPHSNAVWSIMYAIVCTRLDISLVVNVVSEIEWILQYLQGTLYIGLVYDRGSDIGSNVNGYVDLDYAGDLDKRISLTNYISTLLGCAIRWKNDITVDNCFVHYRCKAYGNSKGSEKGNLAKIFGQWSRFASWWDCCIFW